MADSSSAYDGKKVTNTLSGIRVQTAVFLGLPLTYPEKSTLNEHLDINSTILPASDARPTCQYLCIGNKGHTTTAESDGLAGVLPVAHEPTDAAPYGIIPFVLRPVDNDLSDDLRKRYALRRLEEHNGKRYWAYYLRRLSYTGKVVSDYYTKVRDGVKTIVEFKYSDLNLYPSQPELPDYNYDVTDTLTASDGDYVHAAAGISVTLDTFDIEELVNVARVKYQNPTMAIMSEFCLCSGIDYTATGESMVGSPFTYTEAIGVQVAVFLTTFVNVAFNNGGLGYDLQIGQTEAMALSTLVS